MAFVDSNLIAVSLSGCRIRMIVITWVCWELIATWIWKSVLDHSVTMSGCLHVGHWSVNWKTLALAGIWTRDLPGTKPICYQLSYPGLDKNKNCAYKRFPKKVEKNYWPTPPVDRHAAAKRLSDHIKHYYNYIFTQTYICHPQPAHTHTPSGCLNAVQKDLAKMFFI